MSAASRRGHCGNNQRKRLWYLFHFFIFFSIFIMFFFFFLTDRQEKPQKTQCGRCICWINYRSCLCCHSTMPRIAFHSSVPLNCPPVKTLCDYWIFKADSTFACAKEKWGGERKESHLVILSLRTLCFVLHLFTEFPHWLGGCGFSLRPELA